MGCVQEVGGALWLSLSSSQPTQGRASASCQLSLLPGSDWVRKQLLPSPPSLTGSGCTVHPPLSSNLRCPVLSQDASLTEGLPGEVGEVVLAVKLAAPLGGPWVDFWASMNTWT